MPLKHEDLEGKEVTVRLEDGTEVERHADNKREDLTGDDIGGHRGQVLRPRFGGEPVYVRFPG